MARLREALLALTPARQDQVVTVAAKLLVIKARKQRARLVAAQAAQASMMVPVGTQFELFDSAGTRLLVGSGRTQPPGKVLCHTPCESGESRLESEACDTAPAARIGDSKLLRASDEPSPAEGFFFG